MSTVPVGGYSNALAWPVWLEVLLALLVLDLAIWVQHVLFMRCRRCGGCTGSITQISTTT
ncbi:hypothetical protein Thiowin_01579 [Thiorhodovibrio winogradskyi]|uniref:Uncharacterized protein n=1 Tax=Thiorhodovibrio winogradskyi TaxID=77007 RepID=A0ABZ0S7X4_9GAMM|nr:hypothetical protein [Thiorhodovibrio winogradskyi]